MGYGKPFWAVAAAAYAAELHICGSYISGAVFDSKAAPGHCVLLLQFLFWVQLLPLRLLLLLLCCIQPHPDMQQS